jgi:hypothetical protein
MHGQEHYIKEKVKERYGKIALTSYIDGALTKENYLDSIKKAGFKDVDILEEKTYIEEQVDNGNKDTGRKISSILVKAVKE